MKNNKKTTKQHFIANGKDANGKQTFKKVSEAEYQQYLANKKKG